MPASAMHRRCGSWWFPMRASRRPRSSSGGASRSSCARAGPVPAPPAEPRSEEHTSQLQSRENLVCRLLLEKKKKKNNNEKSVTKRNLRIPSTHVDVCLSELTRTHL